jgi:hypothetical protein
MTIPNDRPYSAAREPAGAGASRGGRCCVAAHLLVLVGLGTDILEPLGFTRAALHEPDGGQDVERELQILRLPVLGDVDGEA